MSVSGEHEVVLDKIKKFRETTNLNESHSFFIEHDDHELFHFRHVLIHTGRLKFNSTLYYIEKDKFYKYDKKKHQVHKIADISELISDLKKAVEEVKRIIIVLMQSLDGLEDELLDGVAIRGFMSEWFNLKKEAQKLERYIRRFAEVLEEFDEFFEDRPQIDVPLQGVIQSTLRSLSQAQGTISKLESVFNYYREIKSDKLNKDIYMLTIISAIFLPLNLIVGFFGINTEGLFYKDSPEGTMYVVYTLFATLLLTVMGGTVLRLIDRYILRHLFKRTSIYKVLSQKIEALTENSKL